MPRPGEITLAHRGVLFLEEFPEYTSQPLETLSQPLEDRIVNITRVSGSLTYPANFVLIAAMNPYPCGYFGDPVKQCTWTSAIITRYQKRISGPLLDHIDIQSGTAWVLPRVEYEKLSDNRAGVTPAARHRRPRRGHPPPALACGAVSRGP